MSQANETAEIREFLKSGSYDIVFRNWAGNHALERITKGDEALREALLAEFDRCAQGSNSGASIPVPEAELLAWTERKLEPMVSGLFRHDEREAVLLLLSKSVVFVTEGAIRRLILGDAGLHTAWILANMYLRYHCQAAISDEAPHIVGLSEETTCYVSLEYFEDDDPFADYVVHEAAHIFHNVKRATVGIKSTRRKPWLLPIEFGMRETFAYSCEAFSRISEGARPKRDRIEQFERLQARRPIRHEFVDAEEYIDILKEATYSRNGWKVILNRCGGRKKPGT